MKKLIACLGVCLGLVLMVGCTTTYNRHGEPNPPNLFQRTIGATSNVAQTTVRGAEFILIGDSANDFGANGKCGGLTKEEAVRNYLDSHGYSVVPAANYGGQGMIVVPPPNIVSGPVITTKSVTPIATPGQVTAVPGSADPVRGLSLWNTVTFPVTYQVILPTGGVMNGVIQPGQQPVTMMIPSRTCTVMLSSQGGGVGPFSFQVDFGTFQQKTLKVVESTKNPSQFCPLDLIE